MLICRSSILVIQVAYHGRLWDLAGGARIVFFRFENLHVAKPHAAHGKALRFARGFGGMPPRENF